LATPAQVPVGRRDRFFYTGMAIVAAAILFAGFRLFSAPGVYPDPSDWSAAPVSSTPLFSFLYAAIRRNVSVC